MILKSVKFFSWLINDDLISLNDKKIYYILKKQFDSYRYKIEMKNIPTMIMILFSIKFT